MWAAFSKRFLISKTLRWFHLQITITFALICIRRSTTRKAASLFEERSLPQHLLRCCRTFWPLSSEAICNRDITFWNLLLCSWTKKIFLFLFLFSGEITRVNLWFITKFKLLKSYRRGISWNFSICPFIHGVKDSSPLNAVFTFSTCENILL